MSDSEIIASAYDENVVAKFPIGTEIFSVTKAGFSGWVATLRIETREPDGTLTTYFKKGVGPSEKRGKAMMEGTFVSENTFYSYAPNNVPRPIGWGSYKSDPNSYFYICDFHEMRDKLPNLKKLCALVAQVHKRSMGNSPGGKWGFPVTTHLANVPNDNTWCDTWEEWFTRAMKRILELEIECHEGHETNDEILSLTTPFLQKVIPRLLRPLETDGREIKPTLIHSDLWPGNAKHDVETDEVMIFDSCGYWGHNEAELGPWRSVRYRLDTGYRKEYHVHILPSAPKEDMDARNQLYAFRYEVLLSILYPDKDIFRLNALSTMKELVERYPKGYESAPTASL